MGRAAGSPVRRQQAAGPTLRRKRSEAPPAPAPPLERPRTPADPDHLVFRSFATVIPQPDASLFAESLALEEDDTHEVEVRAQQLVTQAMICAEHGETVPAAFRNYRFRLMWQMVKRAWFSALTDFNTKHLFIQQPPAQFISFVKEVQACLDGATKAVRGAQQARLVLKGGNAVMLLKRNALRLLPPKVQQTLRSLRPTSLSDLDFLLLLPVDSLPPRRYAAVHDALRAQVERALGDLGAAQEGTPRWTRFATAVQGASGQQELQDRLHGATLRVRNEIRDALVAYGHSPSDPRFTNVFAFLDKLVKAKLEARQVPRRSIRIDAASRAPREVVINFHDEPREVYVSNNPDVTHRDSRCVFPEDVCHFALVRTLAAYEVTARDQSLDKMLAGAELDKGDMVRFCKGEVVDVSLPKADDVNLRLWSAQEAECPGSFAVSATVTAAGESVTLLMEALDAQIAEQRDLTFGKRMQSLLIWRIAKVRKRLTRLIELLGIKALTLDGFTWREKAEAVAALQAELARFSVETLPTCLAKKDLAAPLAARKRRQSHAAPRLQPSTRKRRRVVSEGGAKLRASELWELMLAQEMLLTPLDELATKVFSAGRQQQLPRNFLQEWRSVLGTLEAALAPWSQALLELAELQDETGLASLDADALYDIDLGETWDFP